MLMRNQHLYERPIKVVYKLLQVTNTLTQSALFIFLQSGDEKLLPWLVIEPTTLNLGSQSGAHDLSATAPPYMQFQHFACKN